MLRRNERYKGFLHLITPAPGRFWFCFCVFHFVSIYFVSFCIVSIWIRTLQVPLHSAGSKHHCVKLIFILFNCTLWRHLKITVTRCCLFATNELKFSVYNQVIRNTRIRCCMISCSKWFYLIAFSSLGCFRVLVF